MSFDKVWFWTYVFKVFMGMTSFTAIILMLQLLSLNRYIAMFGATLRHSAATIIDFLLILVFIAFCYTSLGFLLYGPYASGFAGLLKSAQTLFVYALGKSEYYHMFTATDNYFLFSPKAFYTSFMLLVMIVMMNLFISLLDESFARVSDDDTLYSYDKELIDHVTKRFAAVLKKITNRDNLSA